MNGIELLKRIPWLQPEDIQACLLYAQRVVGQERIERLFVGDADS